MAVFTYTPDFGIELSIKPAVKVAKFGDGYEQRTSSGINTMPKSWPLSFNARTNSEADAIMAFLSARAGLEAFDWTAPDGTTGKYICREYRRNYARYGVNNISATFEQVFE